MYEATSEDSMDQYLFPSTSIEYFLTQILTPGLYPVLFLHVHYIGCQYTKLFTISGIIFYTRENAGKGGRYGRDVQELHSCVLFNVGSRQIVTDRPPNPRYLILVSGKIFFKLESVETV